MFLKVRSPTLSKYNFMEDGCIKESPWQQCSSEKLHYAANSLNSEWEVQWWITYDLNLPSHLLDTFLKNKRCINITVKICSHSCIALHICIWTKGGCAPNIILAVAFWSGSSKATNLACSRRTALCIFTSWSFLNTQSQCQIEACFWWVSFL